MPPFGRQTYVLRVFESEHGRRWSLSLRLGLYPLTYVQDYYSQLHNFTQGNLNLEEYVSEFEKHIIKCDIEGPEE